MATRKRFIARTPLPILVCLLLVSMAAPPSHAQSWQAGVADNTLGRFGTWPEYSPADDNKYEDNLTARIHPDRLLRTVAGEYYELGFGARDIGEVPSGPSVTILERNWVYKRIHVARGVSNYRLAYNSLSPGFYLSTEEDGYYLVPPEAFAYFTYIGEAGPITEDLSAISIDGVFYRRSTDGDWSENWLLLWCADDAALGVQVPILLVFSDHPRSVRWWDGELFVEFDKTAGTTTDVLCAFIDGVGSRPPAEVADWDLALPAEVEDKCRLLSRSLVPFPSGCLEEFQLDETAGTVTIRNSFSYEPWDDDWSTPAAGLAPLPPVAAYARGRGYPVDLDTAPTDLELPTKLGPYQAYLDTQQLEYTIPAAPLWTVNLVPTADGSIWFDRAQQQVELWAASIVWDFDNAEGGGAWFMASAKGMYESLLVCEHPSRKFFLDRSRHTLEQIILDFGAGSPWLLRQVPDTDHEYHYLIHFTDHPDYPGDQDCGAGAPLEFAYQYGLHSGDWYYLAGEWIDIEKIFHYLEIVSDWAWMASACRDYGAGGAFIDMFPSQWMGYLSYGKMARVLSNLLGPRLEEQADYALYLAAKGMIPLTQRLDFKDGFAGQYWDLAYDEVITGFGEYEPKPHDGIPGFWCGPTSNTIAGYAAKLISGEGFHPLLDEAYKRWVPQDYYKLVELGFDVNGGLSYNLADAPYEYNKIYAFNVVGWDAAEIDQMWSDMHIQDSYYWWLLGYGFYEHAFMYAYQDSRDLPLWAVGNWEPGTVDGVAYDPASGILGFVLTNDGQVAQDITATVLSSEAPLDVRVDGMPVTYSYDPDWQVIEFTVSGAGTHPVAVQVLAAGSKQLATSKSGRDYTGNRVVNGGFEECYVHENWMRPWLVYDLDTINNPRISTNPVHAGEYAMRLHCDGEEDECKTFQNIYIGPHNSYTIRFWYNIPVALQADWHFRVVSQEYNEENPASERWRVLDIPGQHSPTDGWEFVEVQMDPDPLLPDCTIVRLHLRFTNDQGNVYIDDVELVVDSLLAVDDPGDGTLPAPPATRLLGCRPNPFNPSTRIVLTLAHAGPLSLDVYDVRGRLMRTLYGGRQEPGVHEFVWNGRDDLGRECASGNYLVRMRAGVYEKTQKIVLVE